MSDPNTHDEPPAPDRSPAGGPPPDPGVPLESPASGQVREDAAALQRRAGRLRQHRHSARQLAAPPPRLADLRHRGSLRLRAHGPQRPAANRRAPRHPLLGGRRVGGHGLLRDVRRSRRSPRPPRELRCAGRAARAGAPHARPLPGRHGPRRGGRHRPERARARRAGGLGPRGRRHRPPLFHRQAAQARDPAPPRHDRGHHRRAHAHLPRRHLQRAGPLGVPRHHLVHRPRLGGVRRRRRPRPAPRRRDRAATLAPRARGLLDHRRRGGALFPDDGELLAVGSLGDPLRRGIPRDPRPRRLDLTLVGARRLVLLQADPELLDAVDGDGIPRRALPAGQDAGRRHAERGRPPPRVGGPHAGRGAHHPGDVPPLQGGREGLRAQGGAHRGARPCDDARLVLHRPPDDGRHALRRLDDRGDGPPPPRRAER